MSGRDQCKCLTMNVVTTCVVTNLHEALVVLWYLFFGMQGENHMGEAILPSTGTGASFLVLCYCSIVEPVFRVACDFLMAVE